MPPIVGLGDIHRKKFNGTVPPEVNAGAPHRKDLFHPRAHGDCEEVPQQLVVKFNPQEALAQRDKNHDLLDPIRGQVLQLNLVIMEQAAEEAMRRHRKPALVEGDEGYDMPSGGEGTLSSCGRSHSLTLVCSCSTPFLIIHSTE